MKKDQNKTLQNNESTAARHWAWYNAERFRVYLDYGPIRVKCCDWFEDKLNEWKEFAVIHYDIFVCEYMYYSRQMCRIMIATCITQKKSPFAVTRTKVCRNLLSHAQQKRGWQTEVYLKISRHYRCFDYWDNKKFLYPCKYSLRV